MAIALVQKAHQYASGGSPTVTMPSNTTAGNFLVAYMQYNGTTPPSAPTGWTTAVSHLNGSTCYGLLYYSENIAGGTTSYAFPTGAHATTLIIAEYSGVATSSSLDKTGSGATFSAIASASSVTTTSANELLIFGFGTQNTHTTSSLTTGYTMEDNGGGSGAFAWLADQEVSATGTFAPTCHINSSDNWNGCQATFIAASGGGGTVFNATDSVTLDDSSTTLQGNGAPTAETVTPDDSASTQQGQLSSPDPALAVSDADTVTGQLAPVDALTLLDAPQVFVATLAAPTDTLALSDPPTLSEVFLAPVDALTLTEALPSFAGLLAPSDALTATQTFAFAGVEAPAADAVTLSDSAAYSAGSGGTVFSAVADTLTLADTLAFTAVETSATADSVTLSESEAGVGGLSLTDTPLTLSESAVLLSAHVFAPSAETLALVDSAPTFAAILAWPDAVACADTLAALGALASVADTVTLVDAVPTITTIQVSNRSPVGGTVARVVGVPAGSTARRVTGEPSADATIAAPHEPVGSTVER